jgi:hypothetical protein
MAACDNLHGDEVPLPIGQFGLGDIISHLDLTWTLRVNLDIAINRGIVIFPINSHTTDNTSSRTVCINMAPSRGFNSINPPSGRLCQSSVNPST